ncbi:TIGR01212 family radical SAM protein [Selenomonadales bacterium OttesenSCG-928-I06]|nr:TIGR01212 family radical SAM protein [Selenomonadales bacterium OttesenSCG-928-I06]
MRYKVYSDYLKEKYGEKVYKLPINLPLSCPNRDGEISVDGCYFCGVKGAGYESLSNKLSVKEQIQKNKDYISSKYKAKKFIPYFQNFSNTYLSPETLDKYLEEAATASDDIVGISIATRPDCINDKYLVLLQNIKEKFCLDITVELGLQTVNYHTLKKINRGHTLAEFLDAVLKIKKYDFEICAHVILDLPYDNLDDVIETAKVLSSLEIDEVKIHSLYIVKDTKFAKLYEQGNLNLISKEDYINRVVTFLEYLSPDIVIGRLIGRAPEIDTLIANWNTAWWKIKDEIDEKLNILDTWQGKKFNYLNGAAVKKFFKKL